MSEFFRALSPALRCDIQPIDIVMENGTAEGYAAPGHAEQVPNWLQERHAIFDENILNRLKSYAVIAFLNNINVNEESRGQGVGNDILEQFLDCAQGAQAQAVVLLADTSETQNPGFDLVKWYEGWGFKTLMETPSGPLMLYDFAI